MRGKCAARKQTLDERAGAEDVEMKLLYGQHCGSGEEPCFEGCIVLGVESSPKLPPSHVAADADEEQVHWERRELSSATSKLKESNREGTRADLGNPVGTTVKVSSSHRTGACPKRDAIPGDLEYGRLALNGGGGRGECVRTSEWDSVGRRRRMQHETVEAKGVEGRVEKRESVRRAFLRENYTTRQSRGRARPSRRERGRRTVYCAGSLGYRHVGAYDEVGHWEV
ncbi:hypothetical protein R3P38DRAFT_2771917 [Favolaschia claudopus]|uniref:Uncharacterized protein n=1 Tax=Favolaschia claudopus TaxID=2862362 RepID=A0AAW0CAJ0_9AGAR